MSTYVPPEFEYEMPPSPEPVVVSRSEAYLTTPSDSYDTESNKILRFELTGTQMVDLSSIRMYADVQYQKGSTAQDALAARDYVVSNMGLFQSIELTTLSGTIIERIDDANLLAVIMSHLCFSEAWSETSGSYSNSQKDIALHKTAAGRFEINAHKLLGFLHTGKFIMPSLMGGGLRITFTLADAKKLIVLDTASDKLKLTLSNVKLHYDACIMSQRYQEWFNRQYATQGFRIIWDSYQGHTQSSIKLSATPTIQQFPIQVTAKRCKALVMVVRKTADTTPDPATPQTYSGAFLSSGFEGGSYQLDVAGVRYPPTAIDSYARAHEEAVKVCYSNNDVQTENIPLSRFSKDWAYDYPSDTSVVTEVTQNTTDKVVAVTNSTLKYVTDPLSRRQGQFIMCLDFEKYNSSGESGIVISPNSARVSLALKKAGDKDDYELASYLVRSQSLTVVGGQVVVDY